MGVEQSLHVGVLEQCKQLIARSTGEKALFGDTHMMQAGTMTKKYLLEMNIMETFQR